jgi:hypothetical protein
MVIIVMHLLFAYFQSQVQEEKFQIKFQLELN